MPVILTEFEIALNVPVTPVGNPVMLTPFIPENPLNTYCIVPIALLLHTT